MNFILTTATFFTDAILSRRCVLSLQCDALVWIPVVGPVWSEDLGLAVKATRKFDSSRRQFTQDQRTLCPSFWEARAKFKNRLNPWSVWLWLNACVWLILRYSSTREGSRFVPDPCDLWTVLPSLNCRKEDTFQTTPFCWEGPVNFDSSWWCDSLLFWILIGTMTLHCR